MPRTVSLRSASNCRERAIGPLPQVDQARAELRRTVAAGGSPTADLVDTLILPLVEQAVPEWQRTLDLVLGLAEIAYRVGFSGGVIANMGGHTGVPAFAGEDAIRFFARHLGQPVEPDR